jgi:hypothetical protein
MSTALRETMDKLKDKLKSAAIVLASVVDGKVTLIAGVTADLTGKVKAGELVNMVAQQVGGKGGGRPDMAQAGGTQPENLAGGAGFGNGLGRRQAVIRRLGLILLAAAALADPVPPIWIARHLRRLRSTGKKCIFSQWSLGVRR